MITSSTLARLQEFIDGVISGEIVACKLVRIAVDRHVRDLKRQNTDEFPYFFDNKHAQFACEFFPLVLRHSIGDFAKLPFELTDWQVFFLSMLFGWKRAHDSSRRFRRFLLEIARKGGKSTFVAGLVLLLASMDVNPVTRQPEAVAEVVLAATKLEQSQKVIYAEVVRMRNQSEHIKKRSKSVGKQIEFTHNSGSIRSVGSDKSFDGLNPHAVILDEMHEWKEKHRDFYDTMQTGSGSRSQPIIGTITTAGTNQSLLWNEEHDYAVSVLQGQHTDESIFVLIFQLDDDDDPFDEDNWIKANPSLPVTPKLTYLREEANKAKFSQINLNRFKRYHCNQKISGNSQAFNMEVWDQCVGQLSDWREADAIAYAVDNGGHDDLAAFAGVARFLYDERDDVPIYRYEARTWQFMSAETSRDLNAPPWNTWIKDGQLIQSDYVTTELLRELIQQVDETGCHAVAYDKYNAQQLGEMLSQQGIECAKFAQNYSSFNEPIVDLMAVMREGRFRHDGSSMLRWCVGNAIAITNTSGLVMFNKRDSKEKIDPVIALTMAFRIASTAPRASSGSLFIS